MATATNDITETIELARGGSTEAFGRIVRQYQSLVSGVLFSATGDFHRSEDLTQETFLIAWNKLGELRETENLAAWLCSIARNLAHRSKRGKTANMVHGSLEDETASSEPGPETELLRREQSELVWSAIGDLDEPYRETLVLYYRSGQSVKEIAEATASTEENIRQRLVRARKSLKSKIEQMVGDILTDTAPGDLFTVTVMTAVGAAVLSSTTQAAVAATTGTTATTAIGTGSATGGKALGAATFWTVLGPVAYVAWFLSMFIGFFWAAVRNAPTLRARRFRVYSIFWCLQYYAVFCIAVGLGGTAIFMVACRIFQFNPTGVGGFYFIMFFVPMMLVMLPIQAAYYRKLKGIIENDLGLPGPRIESYDYPQVERRFFLSLITNTLLIETLLGFFVCLCWTDGSGSDPKFMLSVSIGIGFAVLVGTIHCLLGRYFLETCRTKENFLASPPLIDKPLEAALLKSGVSPVSVDHPARAGFMSGFLLLTWIGMAGFGVWYFSLYSWDKHPITLGICAALTFGVFCIQPVFARKAKNQKSVFAAGVLQALFLPSMIVALEIIEFGSLSALLEFGAKRAPVGSRGIMIHNMNLTWLIMCAFFIPFHLVKWLKARRQEDAEKEFGRDTLIREAIARFKPEELVGDEPVAEAKPFPKRWTWILGLYGAAIIAVWCLGVLIPNPFDSKKTLERNENFTALIALEPDNPMWYYKRGVRENAGKAYVDFSTAIRLKPDFADAYTKRANAAMDEDFRWNDHMAQAALVDGKVVSLPKDETLSVEEIKRENARLALEDAGEAIRLDPKNWRHYNQRAGIRTGLGDLDGAEADYNETIRLNSNSMTYYNRGLFIDYWKKDSMKALADFTTAIRLAEKEKAGTGYSEFPLVILYRDRGNLYEKLGEPDKAKADFEKAK